MEISEERYNELIDTEQRLIALENGGVDDWEWYEDSLEPYWNWKKEQERKEDV